MVLQTNPRVCWGAGGGWSDSRSGGGWNCSGGTGSAEGDHPSEYGKLGAEARWDVSPKTTEVLPLPPGTSGKIIGLEGANVRDLAHSSGASISVRRQDGTVSLQISGPPEAVARAKASVDDTLASLASRQSTPRSNNHRVRDGQGQAGTPISQLRVGSQVRGTVVDIVPATGIWFDVGAKKRGLLRADDTGGRSFDVDEVVEGLRVRSVDLHEESFSLLPPLGPGDEVAKLDVPRSLLTVLAGGSRVASIARQSGAQVLLDESSPQPVVHLSGQPQAVTLASALIEALLDGARDMAAAGPEAIRLSSRAEMELEEVQLPSGLVPFLIGKGGSCISHIRLRSGARILIQDMDDHAVARISGSPENVAAAKAMIEDKLKSYPLQDNNKGSGWGAGKGAASWMNAGKGDSKGSHEVKEKVELPPGSTPIIVGMGGSRILDMQAQSGATIYIDDSRLPHRACLAGDPDAVARARELVQGVLDQTLEVDYLGQRKRIYKPRGRVRGFGGETPCDAVVIPETFTSRFIGKSGERIRRMMQDSGAQITVSTAPGVSSRAYIAGSREAVARAKSLAQYEIGQIAAADEQFRSGKGMGKAKGEGDWDPIYEPITLAHEHVSMIIGRGGANIQRVQAESGARMMVSETHGQTPTVWFSGSPESVVKARAAVLDLLEDFDPNKGGKGDYRSKGKGKSKGKSWGQAWQQEEGGHSYKAPFSEQVELSEAVAQLAEGQNGLIARVQSMTGASLSPEDRAGGTTLLISGSSGAVTWAKALVQDMMAEERQLPPPSTPRAGYLHSSRQDLFREIFERCDMDGDGYLCRKELLGFARLAGWLDAGGGADWSRDFDELCGEAAADPLWGLDRRSLDAIVRVDAARGLSDARLESMHETLAVVAQLKEILESKLPAARTGPSVRQGWEEPTRPPSRTPRGSQSRMRRTDLVAMAFTALDQDEDGRLNQNELRRFAERTGFDGGEQDWSSTYSLLCEEFNADPRRGIDETQFAALVNDTGQAAGCFCNDEELRSIMQAAGLSEEGPERGSRKGMPGGRRSELIRAVFDTLDVDGDSLLNEQELLPFAWHTGFPGTRQEWSREFNDLCTETGCTAVDHTLFYKLVNDRSEDTGCYCRDADLRTMLVKFAPRSTRQRGEVSESGASSSRLGRRAASTGRSRRSAPSNASTSRSEIDLPKPTGFSGAARALLENTPSVTSDRSALLRALFQSLDSKGAGRLQQQDLRKLCERWLQFYSDRDWEVTCRRLQVPEHSIDPLAFERLMGFGQGFAITDVQLREALHSAPGPSEGRKQPESGPAQRKPRSALKREVFDVLAGKDGKLEPLGLRRLLEHTGCYCNDKEWARMYQGWCVRHGRGDVETVDFALFEALVDGESGEDGCACTNDALESLLKVWQHRASASAPVDSAHDRHLPPTRRGELQRELFRLLDKDRDGRLNQGELLRFAHLTGFQGDNWAELFGHLCSEFGVDPMVGVSQALLVEMTNDDSEDSACYCTDSELEAMVKELIQDRTL